MRLRRTVAGALALVWAATSTLGEGRMIEDFKNAPDKRWEFISDQVMGGVSEGRVSLDEGDGQTVLRLQGKVSTANRGGFIQARLKLAERLPKEAEGLELKVRGNGQKYYIHARTSGTVLPWNFYQAPFDVSEGWATVRIPFTAFEAQGMLVSKRLKAEAVKSIAVVAYGRDHTADVSVASISTY